MPKASARYSRRSTTKSQSAVRHGDPQRDGAACAAIYAQSFDAGGTTFEEVPPDADEMGSRIAEHASTHAFIVVEVGDRVVGYAYANPHRERAAYRWSAEVSVYVDAGRRRAGVGRELYAALIELLRRQGIRTVLGGITLPNDASVALHESLGFEVVGVYRRIGWKLGSWHDVGWWQLDLAPGDAAEPAEPLAPQRLH